jgi:hypothetical protein
MGIDIYSIALDYPDTIIQVKAGDLVEAAHVFMEDLALVPERETRGRKATKETSEPSNPKTLLTKREVMKLIALKKKHSLTLLIISHTPKRNLSNPITQNDLAGSRSSTISLTMCLRLGSRPRTSGSSLSSRKGQGQ